MVFGHSAGLVSVSLKLSHIGLRLSRAFFFSTFLFRFGHRYRTALRPGCTYGALACMFACRLAVAVGCLVSCFSNVQCIISVQGFPASRVRRCRSAHSRGGRVSARDEGAFHFSIYGFTLSALTRYYTFLVHKTRILFPFEVMILYVAVPEMRSLKSHAPSHLRTHARPHRTHFGPYQHSARQMFHSHLALVYRKVRVRFPGLEAGADRGTSQ